MGQAPAQKQAIWFYPWCRSACAVPQDCWSAFRQRTGRAVIIDGGASFEALVMDPARFVGDIPVALSFHATKSFSTAEGGCVVTTDTALARRVREALNFGFFDARNCMRASTNGKLSEYHAAVGLASADAWPAAQVDLRRVAEGYAHRLAAVGLGGRIQLMPTVAGCYAIDACLDAAEASLLRRSLDDAGVETRAWYGEGLHRQTPDQIGAPRPAADHPKASRHASSPCRWHATSGTWRWTASWPPWRNAGPLRSIARVRLALTRSTPAPGAPARPGRGGRLPRDVQPVAEQVLSHWKHTEPRRPKRRPGTGGP